MEHRIIIENQLTLFAQKMREDERSPGTIENYVRHVRAFAAWMGGNPATKETAAAWKEHLLSRKYSPGTINGMLVSLNRFFDFLGWQECKVKPLRIQRRLFREDSKELTREEYQRLLAAARALGRERLELLMETICATGIRVSEVKYITVEALACGKVEISLKGKIRTILIPGKLCKKLKKYAKKKRTALGEIFITKNGTGLSRKQIWAEMKAICQRAKVAASKVFPHNLRHLFARTFYKVCRDVAKLADVLGHSSIETTRIYLISTGKEHKTILGQHRTIAEASAVESPIRRETIGFPAHFFARAHNFKPPGRACQPEADSPMRT